MLWRWLNRQKSNWWLVPSNNKVFVCWASRKRALVTDGFRCNADDLFVRFKLGIE